jgi:hypothetical protein
MVNHVGGGVRPASVHKITEKLMADTPLSQEWTPEEAAQYSSGRAASTPEAVTVGRGGAQGRAGGADHRPGHEAAADDKAAADAASTAPREPRSSRRETEG